MGKDERFQVENPEVQRALRTLATLIADEVPDGWVWGLFLARIGEHEAEPKGRGAVFWISSGDRAGMVDVVQSWIDDQRKRAPAAAKKIETTGDDSLFRKFMSEPGDEPGMHDLQTMAMGMSQAELQRFVEGTMLASVIAQDQFKKRFPAAYAAWDAQFGK